MAFSSARLDIGDRFIVARLGRSSMARWRDIDDHGEKGQTRVAAGRYARFRATLGHVLRVSRRSPRDLSRPRRGGQTPTDARAARDALGNTCGTISHARIIVSAHGCLADRGGHEMATDTEIQ